MWRPCNSVKAVFVTRHGSALLATPPSPDRGHSISKSLQMMKLLSSLFFWRGFRKQQETSRVFVTDEAGLGGGTSLLHTEVGSRARAGVGRTPTTRPPPPTTTTTRKHERYHHQPDRAEEERGRAGAPGVVLRHLKGPRPPEERRLSRRSPGQGVAKAVLRVAADRREGRGLVLGLERA